MKIRRDGRPLNNQLFIQEDATKGKRGRIVPITVMPFETMTNYAAAASLRCNFDNQTLLYLPPGSVLKLVHTPNIGRQPQYAHMERKEGDMEPKWLLPVVDGSIETDEVDTLPRDSIETCKALLKELEAECVSAFQDAHNTGFYINVYTTKVNALGEKILQGLRKASEKIVTEERARTSDVAEDPQRRADRERIKAVLKKLVYLMNSLQVKSGSELAFPMLFDHMSFSTHRTWEMNMKVPYAKALSSWERHFGRSLKTLRQDTNFAVQLGFILPSQLEGPQKHLPKGWLILPSETLQTPNTKSMADTLQAETGESQEYVYISPKGSRFLSLKAALAHVDKEPLLDTLPQDSSLPPVTATTVEFTSNHEDYMHRNMEDILAELPAYVYNMWVYKATKLTSANRHAFHHLDIPFEASYRQGNVKIQRLSIMPRIPQIEGLFVPSPDVDPHKNALIKLLLFKPIHAEAEMDEQGDAIDPYKQLYMHKTCPTKHHKGDPDKNPYNAFVETWRHYGNDTVLVHAGAADEKLNRRMEWPSIWECKEIFVALMKLAHIFPFHDPSMSEDEQMRLLENSSDVQAKLQDRLSILEYCCYTIRSVATNLDAFARAKAAPKTKSYALDADATEDPTVHRIPETGDDESYEAAPEDMLDADIDGYVTLKAGEAPEKVHHPLSDDARLKALAFSRKRPSKFVRDMISAGLLPITCDLQKFNNKQSASKLVGQRTAEQVQDLHELRRLASSLPSLSKELLDEQRAAFEASAHDARAIVDDNEPAHRVDTEHAPPMRIHIFIIIIVNIIINIIIIIITTISIIIIIIVNIITIINIIIIIIIVNIIIIIIIRYAQSKMAACAIPICSCCCQDSRI